MVMSKRFKLNKEDGIKIAKGAGIAVAGALLTFGADLIPMIDFGQYDAMVAALLMILINAGLKWYADKGSIVA